MIKLKLTNKLSLRTDNYVSRLLRHQAWDDAGLGPVRQARASHYPQSRGYDGGGCQRA